MLFAEKYVSCSFSSEYFLQPHVTSALLQTGYSFVLPPYIYMYTVIHNPYIDFFRFELTHAFHNRNKISLRKLTL
jgi:hypothetical protein